MKILYHHGTMCLLPKPVISGKQAYPFGFNPAQREVEPMHYRVLSSSDPTCVTGEQLVEMLRSARRPLNAIWEEQAGHKVGWLTIYSFLRQDSTTTTPYRVYLEQGPDVESPHPAQPDTDDLVYANDRTPENETSNEPAPDSTPDIGG
jgi:hypothetical protein